MSEQIPLPERKRQAGAPARPIGMDALGAQIFPDAQYTPRSFGFIRRDDSARATVTWTEVRR